MNHGQIYIFYILDSHVRFQPVPKTCFIVICTFAICQGGRKPIPTNSNLLQLLPVKVGVGAKAGAWITSEGVLKLQNAENQCNGELAENVVKFGLAHRCTIFLCHLDLEI